MRKTREYVHRLRADNGAVGRFGVRVYEAPGELPVIVCSKYPDHPISPTNYCENLAAEVVLGTLGGSAVRAGKREKYFEWVEHYPEPIISGKPGQRFYLVDFADYRVRGGINRRRVRDPRKGLDDALSPLTRPAFGLASWTPADEADIEEMIGAPLDDFPCVSV